VNDLRSAVLCLALAAIAFLVFIPHVGVRHASGSAGPTGSVPSTPEVLSPEAMAEDLEHLIETIEKVHPDPYAYTSRRTIRRMYEAALTRLNEPARPRDFFREAARLAAAFGDGHTLVALPHRRMRAALKNGSTLLPLSVERRPTGLRIDRACKDAVDLEGRRLSVVQDRSAERLHDEIQSLISGPKRYRSVQADDQFPYYAWAMGLSTPYRVVTTSPEGTAHRDTVAGLTMIGVGSCFSNARRPAFQFERVTDDAARTVGVMTINSLAPTQRVRRGIQDALRTVQNAPVDGLVIDLRHNRGGSTETVMHVLAPFTDGPIRLTARKSWKISDPYKAYLKARDLGPAAYQRARSGKVIDIEYDPMPLPDTRFRFSGPIAILVGPRTFSAAVKLADVAQYYGIATIVGSETGGRPSGFGEAYPFRLPNSGFRAMASIAEYTRLNERQDGRGVIPDVPVPDMHVGTTDVAMATAVRLVSNR